MTAHRPTGRSPAWVLAADAALDGSVLAFAVWTVLYGIAIAYRLNAWLLGEAWVPAAAVIVVGCVLRELRLRRPSASEPPPTAGEHPRWRTPARHVLLGTGLACALVAAVLAFRGPTLDFRLLWATGLAAAVLLGTWAATSRRESTTDGVAARLGPVIGTGTHVAAAAVVLGLAAFTMFVRNPNNDDVYYVNRSVWVAEHGTFALHDTIFGPDRLPSTYGPPVASLEGLLGSLAHLVGASGAAFTYLVAAPVFVVLAGWAVWRLAAEWAPRRALLVLVVALMVALWCATGIVGNFSYSRIWQGKVLGICLVVPLAWLYLTRLARARGRAGTAWTLLLLLAMGVAFVGMTTTAVIMAPVMAAAAVLAALVLRRRGLRLAAGAALFAAGPVATGVAVLLLTPEVRDIWQRTKTPLQSFVLDFGSDRWLIALLVVGLLAGPVLVRTQEGRALAGAASFTVLAVMTPGLFHLLDAVTGAGPIDYRLLLVAPLPVLAGLLVAVPVPPSLPVTVHRATAVLVGAGLVALVVLGGTPQWSPAVAAGLTSRPTWKVRPDTLAQVNGVLALHPGPGPVLLPRRDMAVLALRTTRVFAVVPRRFYLHGLPEEAGEVAWRKALIRVIAPAVTGPPSVHRVRRALTALDVSVACNYSYRTASLDVLERAGYGSPLIVGKLICLTPPPVLG